MKDKMWITLVLFAMICCFSVAVRVYYINDVAAEILIKDDLLDKAQIDASGFDAARLFSKGISVETVYTCLLSGFCLFFGNFAIAGVYLNALLQTVTVLVLLFAVKWLSNRYVSTVVGVVLAAMPLYLQHMYEISVWNLVILLCAVVLLIPAGLIKKIRGAVRSRKHNRIEAEVNAEMEEIGQENASTKSIKFIENPLPVPKRRAHKEMDYALQTAENDDYDIKDISDKDFFDID